MIFIYYWCLQFRYKSYSDDSEVTHFQKYKYIVGIIKQYYGSNAADILKLLHCTQFSFCGLEFWLYFKTAQIIVPYKILWERYTVVIWLIYKFGIFKIYLKESCHEICARNCSHQSFVNQLFHKSCLIGWIRWIGQSHPYMNFGQFKVSHKCSILHI